MDAESAIIYTVAQILASAGGALIGTSLGCGKRNTLITGVILTGLGIGIAVARVAAVIIKSYAP